MLEQAKDTNNRNVLVLLSPIGSNYGDCISETVPARERYLKLPAVRHVCNIPLAKFLTLE